MHEAILRDFLNGSRAVKRLRDDLVNANVRTGKLHQHTIVDMAEDFPVSSAHLIRVCDAVLAGELEPAELESIGFCLIASDHFCWDTTTPDGEMVAETVHDWSSPEINYPLTLGNVSLFRERLLTGRDVFRMPRGKC